MRRWSTLFLLVIAALTASTAHAWNVYLYADGRYGAYQHFRLKTSQRCYSVLGCWNDRSYGAYWSDLPSGSRIVFFDDVECQGKSTVGSSPDGKVFFADVGMNHAVTSFIVQEYGVYPTNGFTDACDESAILFALFLVCQPANANSMRVWPALLVALAALDCSTARAYHVFLSDGKGHEKHFRLETSQRCYSLVTCWNDQTYRTEFYKLPTGARIVFFEDVECQGTAFVPGGNRMTFRDAGISSFMVQEYGVYATNGFTDLPSGSRVAFFADDECQGKRMWGTNKVFFSGFWVSSFMLQEYGVYPTNGFTDACQESAILGAENATADSEATNSSSTDQEAADASESSVP
ncbi:hypothetical protein BBJ28_00008907 [Nothophytophthora sp. Chile5]|nr:hypothetical protein BBJ28_00008907 [Nothophytophthora sp. Chile5]